MLIIAPDGPVQSRSRKNLSRLRQHVHEQMSRTRIAFMWLGGATYTDFAHMLGALLAQLYRWTILEIGQEGSFLCDCL